MAFSLPSYQPPDFTQSSLDTAPMAQFAEVRQPGVAPESYHATSVFPEYFHLRPGVWQLPAASRMDCVVVRQADGRLVVKEFRRLTPGDQVACGRSENGEDGIYVHTNGFGLQAHEQDKFAFRTCFTRESSFSIDYDRLYELIEFERRHGFILWVLGPALVFDRDSRNAFAALVEQGYVHGLLAGNALPTHDIEGALYGTALGQGLYSKQSTPLGHYKHLDTLNTVRALGSMWDGINRGLIKDGIMRALIATGIPYVLAGSIRDDGPLPETIADAYEAQDRMRGLTCQATTVIALATQLHAIATGNLLPAYTVTATGTVRPVYFYSVDMSEFAVSKLANRGSLTARAILTNVQDFIVTLERGLMKMRG